MVRHFGLDQDPLIRQRLADVYINFQVAKYNNQRALDKIKSGQLPGPEMSIAKLSLTNNMWRTGQLRGRGARPAAHRRHRRVGHLPVEPVPAAACPA